MRSRVPIAAIAIVATAKLGLQLAFAGNYGWHIDELYFVASSRHLDWGYVDYPPLTPLLARLDQALFPGSLVALRALPAFAGAAIVVLTALIARELGAGPRGQVFAAVMALLSPLLLGANLLFHTVTFDELCWAVAILLFVRVYGPTLGLPEAVSPHLSFWYWAPPRMDPQTAVFVGYTTSEADRYFVDCRQVATITNDAGVTNDFTGEPIVLCTQPREPLWMEWPGMLTLD